VSGINDLWQIDLMDMQKFKRQNSGYRYVCVIIDCFSKYVWLKPIKNKTGQSIVKALALLLMTERPKLIQADQGTEFFNKKVSKMLEAFGPKLYHTFSDKKASIVERVQRTIRMRLGRMFTENGDKKWIDKCADIADSYNNSYHRSIKMKPADVTKQHTEIIYKRLFPSTPLEKAKFKLFDKVRLRRKKTFMEKEYTPKWSEEIYTIKRVKRTNPVTYNLIDPSNLDVKGSLYTEELQHAS
tara:strand:+ start:940 stop:1662 length:723 start_codon:yes stop_codon:yes gene_type:complete